MEGDDKIRACSKCQKRVYNLTAMSRAEVDQLLATRDGRMCVRYFRRADGRIMTSDCPQGVKRTKRQRLAATAGLMLTLLNLVRGAVPPQIRGEWNTGDLVAPAAPPIKKELHAKTAQPTSGTLPHKKPSTSNPRKGKKKGSHETIRHA